MFAQLFAEPLFTPDSSSRELQAIESEFQKKRYSDGVRSETLSASFARDGHPWTLFGWGNLESLDQEPKAKGVSLHDELNKFFAEHYKASRMRVCVFGIESLDSLQNAVVESFSAIPASPGCPALSFSDLPLPLTPESLPRLVRVKPIQDTHSLSLTWQFPSHLKHHLFKSESYVSSLLGDEGHGSVLSYLKDRGLATELSAGAGSDNFEHSSNSMVFNVYITLTEQGVREWPSVVSAVFQYIKVLRSYGASNLPRYPYEEKTSVAKMSYRFQQEKDPCDLVQDLSGRMLPLYCHEPEHLLVGPWRYEGFREDLVTELLDGLTVQSCFLMLLSSSYGRATVPAGAADDSGSDASGEEGEEEEGEGDANDAEDSAGGDSKRPRVDDQAAATTESAPAPPPIRLDPHFDAFSAESLASILTEPRFGTEYWVSEVAEELRSSWAKADVAPEGTLHVPEPNAFIATDFSLLEDDAVAAEEERFVRTPVAADFPVLAGERQIIPPRRLELGTAAESQEPPNVQLWHRSCAQRFAQPRSEVWLKVSCPHYALDPTNLRKEVMAHLYVNCLQDSLNETLYPASKARLRCNVLLAQHGLSIKGGGFSQRLLPFVERVLAGLRLETYCARSLLRFQAQKEDLLRSYRNAWLKPQSHCAQLRRLLLMPAASRPEEEVRALEDVGVNELLGFERDFLGEIGCDVLVMGNTSADEAVSWATTVAASRLPSKPRPQQTPEQDVVQLAPGYAAVWLELAVDPSQRNSAVELYWQLPGRDGFEGDESRTRLKVLYFNLYRLLLCIVVLLRGFDTSPRLSICFLLFFHKRWGHRQSLRRLPTPTRLLVSATRATCVCRAALKEEEKELPRESVLRSDHLRKRRSRKIHRLEVATCR
eukprot:TRINITY_DN7455_c0_g2_i2.p1 TRINITY_DN7455_c0_g2~~TRINITY_DN7455_c0_g2_i2.p1  ORF type:complete len:880 (-),score=182.57 TRINITY_DN7455_c0_g2_i2:1355-3994(-)